jgi:hypothetical protein
VGRLAHVSIRSPLASAPEASRATDNPPQRHVVRGRVGRGRGPRLGRSRDARVRVSAGGWVVSVLLFPGDVAEEAMREYLSRRVHAASGISSHLHLHLHLHLRLQYATTLQPNYQQPTTNKPTTNKPTTQNAFLQQYASLSSYSSPPFITHLTHPPQTPSPLPLRVPRRLPLPSRPRPRPRPTRHCTPPRPPSLSRASTCAPTASARCRTATSALSSLRLSNINV